MLRNESRSALVRNRLMRDCFAYRVSSFARASSSLQGNSKTVPHFNKITYLCFSSLSCALCCSYKGKKLFKDCSFCIISFRTWSSSFSISSLFPPVLSAEALRSSTTHSSSVLDLTRSLISPEKPCRLKLSVVMVCVVCFISFSSD